MRQEEIQKELEAVGEDMDRMSQARGAGRGGVWDGGGLSKLVPLPLLSLLELLALPSVLRPYLCCPHSG